MTALVAPPIAPNARQQGRAPGSRETDFLATGCRLAADDASGILEQQRCNARRRHEAQTRSATGFVSLLSCVQLSGWPRQLLIVSFCAARAPAAAFCPASPAAAPPANVAKAAIAAACPGVTFGSPPVIAPAANGVNAALVAPPTAPPAHPVPTAAEPQRFLNGSHTFYWLTARNPSLAIKSRTARRNISTTSKALPLTNVANLSPSGAHSTAQKWSLFNTSTSEFSNTPSGANSSCSLTHNRYLSKPAPVIHAYSRSAARSRAGIRLRMKPVTGYIWNSTSSSP
ncbi:hypothetical protein BW23_4415 [Burkholderia ubonensis MSMB22]|nr:hypothetical protein BW23_4415 [Burkholderia ubonensis MSMB22]